MHQRHAHVTAVDRRLLTVLGHCVYNPTEYQHYHVHERLRGSFTCLLRAGSLTFV